MDKILHINGVQIAVTQYNAQPSKVRKGTLVLLHGFTGSAYNWKPLVDQLMLLDMQVIAIDMLGHGRSSAPEEPSRYAIHYCRTDIIATLEALGVHAGEAILLGYSMGGRIALYTAFAPFFRALILESASPGLADPTERAQRLLSDNALADSIERDGIAAFVERWERLPLFASQRNLPATTRQTLHNLRLRNRPRGLANSLRGVGTGAQPSLHAQLPALTIPILLLAGELDTKFCTIARQMQQQISNATLYVVPNAGHTIHLEQPVLFVQQVKQFLQ